MHQVYLLLRNNQQTGPFTLEQLLERQLKPFDLVWVEGRSAAWQYPGEVASLKPYVPAAPQSDQPYMPLPTAVLDADTLPAAAFPTQAYTPPPAAAQQPPKKIFVSMPRTAAYVPPAPEPVAPPAAMQPVIPTPTPAPAPAPDTKYARTLDEVEEAYTNWVYREKTQKKKWISPKDAGAVAVLLLIIGGGYWVMSRPSATAPARTGAPAVAAVTATPVTTAAAPEEEPTTASTSTTTLPAVHEAAPAATPNKNLVKNTTTKPQPAPVRTAGPAAEADLPAEKPVARETASPTQAAPPAPTAPSGTEEPKKKKLRDVFKGLFSKKEKPVATTAPTKAAPQQQEEPRPATNRQAARRGDESSAPPAAPAHQENGSLADQVDISSNAPESWMMGVSGLKVTLRNRSSTVLQSAAVEVLYYDQNDKLLEKKILYFSGVPSRGKQTLPAPDHKWADHVQFKLGTVTAKDDRYAGTK